MALVNIAVFIDGVEQHAHRRRKLHWTVGPVSEQNIIQGPNGVDMTIQLTDTQQVAVQVAGVDQKGFPAAVETVTFTSSDTTVAAVVSDAADPSKATVTAGVPGTAQIVVTADSKIGEGEHVLTGTLDVTVVPGEASVISVTPGTPEEQP